MSEHRCDRPVFFGLLALVLATGGGGMACAAEPPTPGENALPGNRAPAAVRIAEPGEPGTPLLVEGTVYAPDGRTPVAGAVLYVYQTDATGEYGNRDGAPRLRGWMKTDANGHYEYRTIRPASYPGTRIPAHIHTQLWGAGYAPQWNHDLLFEDDPTLGEKVKAESREAGRFAWVCSPTPAGEAARCTHDLRLKEDGDSFEANTRHGLDSPAARATP